MKYQLVSLALASTVAGLCVNSQVAQAGSISQFNDRTTFNNTVGDLLTVEDFTSTFHFPISTGILNSNTNLPGIGIFPGDIQPGVTYSTPIGTDNFFNIDAGGGYSGGFLDGFNPSNRDVTIEFDNPVSAFGFDIGSLGANTFDVTVQFTSGADQTFNNSYPSQISFFGFQSSLTDITSVIVSNNGSFFGFDFDNFTFGGVSQTTSVPEPSSTLGFLALATLGAASTLKRKLKSSQSTEKETTKVG